METQLLLKPCHPGEGSRREDLPIHTAVMHGPGATTCALATNPEGDLPAERIFNQSWTMCKEGSYMRYASIYNIYIYVYYTFRAPLSKDLTYVTHIIRFHIFPEALILQALSQETWPAHISRKMVGRGIPGDVGQWTSFLGHLRPIYYEHSWSWV